MEAGRLPARPVGGGAVAARSAVPVVRPAGSLGERAGPRIRAPPGAQAARGRKPRLQQGERTPGRGRTLIAIGVPAIETDPPMVPTHVPMSALPPVWANLHDRVHNNEPLRTTPHINACVEHTDDSPVPLGSLMALAKRLLACDVPDGATTGDRIRSAEAPSGVPPTSTRTSTSLVSPASPRTFDPYTTSRLRSPPGTLFSRSR